MADSKSHFIQPDDDLIPDLMHAALRGDIDEAKSLLYGVSPDVRDPIGRTALSWAACYNWTGSSGNIVLPERFVQFLLDRGADPDLGDQHGETPLHYASKAGDPQMVMILLRKGAGADIPDQRGRTPLSRAADRGRAQVVKTLLTVGKADPDGKDNRGRTPLSLAAGNCHLETATLLLEHGASVDAHDHEGQIPLWWFINCYADRRDSTDSSQEDVGFHKWLAMLGPTSGIDPLTKLRRTFLSWACERGDKQLVRHLLQTTWADPKSIDRYRKTPLIYALDWNHHDVADMLISGIGSAGRKKDVVSLRLMVEESRSRILKTFLGRYKPNLHEEDEHSSISLMRMALQRGDRRTVTVLLNHGANIHGLDSGDWFGPCSSSNPSSDPTSNSTRTARWPNSIPLMRMALEEGERAAFVVLLDYRARMLEAVAEQSDDDLYFVGGNRSSVAVHISAFREGRKAVRWVMDEHLNSEVRELPKSSEETHLFLFRENHPWPTYSRLSYISNELWFSLGNKSPCRTFTLSIRMNLKIADNHRTEPGEDPNYMNGTLRTIEWAVLEAPPKTVHYFSNLRYGWIPRNDLELAQLFLRSWREDWMTFSQDARRYLGRLRSRQLTARGKDDLLIDTIAENMLQWTQIEATLSDQLTQARSFVTQYERFSETLRFGEHMGKTLDNIEREISSQIDKLEQAVRGLLHIEFAWVTINEAHRSTSVTTSMKRISWITFIFLPLMFASTLFGMNVDLLKDNPTRQWYPLVGGVLLLLTVTAWVSTKFANVSGWVERKAQDLIPRVPRLRRAVDKDLRIYNRAWQP